MPILPVDADADAFLFPKGYALFNSVNITAMKSTTPEIDTVVGPMCYSPILLQYRPFILDTNYLLLPSWG